MGGGGGGMQNHFISFLAGPKVLNLVSPLVAYREII